MIKIKKKNLRERERKRYVLCVKWFWSEEEERAKGFIEVGGKGMSCVENGLYVYYMFINSYGNSIYKDLSI